MSRIYLFIFLNVWVMNHTVVDLHKYVVDKYKVQAERCTTHRQV